ncbi:NADH:flavin oxidoreductase/NADH oxidase [uncultured Thalassospira sp.]|jgi:2,4-dienoyl-CoA reductase-like NADH-dependent reductase (Old Yellow Enzyme family)|uniref:NADH:flavin oxidoreductase/NADH oxidase n=1 Tax=uncultured Thalassospira sp. TaxID=404382 RepID=UPI0030DB2E2E|tara:strand:+ start:4444 stop:5538 length:1095 start_codon:yes stop_codon:yes gene_type:complete
MSHLFTPLALGKLELDNRIIIAPMCQYSADNGKATDWHTIHLGNLALSGASLLILEATAVAPEGRITYADLGLWDDETENALAHTLKAVRANSDMPIAIQLGHAGRKASTAKPWDGGHALRPDDENGWQVVAPSAVPFLDGNPVPEALSKDRIAEIVARFAKAAKRADRLGIDAIELHGAHGYLIHQFLSPLSNRRSDEYGGSLENRMRFALEIYDAVRAAFGADKPVGIRISASDWVKDGWDIEQSVVLAKALKERGCDFIHVSSGGLHAAQQIPVGPSYQVPFAQRIKAETGLTTIAVGLITEAEQAEAIIGTGQADAIALARGILYDPRWPWHAAAKLGATITPPNQYLRCQPHTLKQLFK